MFNPCRCVRRLATAFILLSAALGFSTSSAQQRNTLETAVVTPSRLSQSIDDALPSTSVITRSDIDRWQAYDLVSILSRTTGVEFAQSGGRGAAASLFVRGANSSQVLVLVDGVRLNPSTGGAAAVGGIALDAIDRIEVVRGNLSSVYGSAAIGGVVQIFTRKGTPNGLTVMLEGGQGRTFNGNVSGAFDAGGVSIGGALGGGTTSAFSAIDASRPAFPGGPPIANPDIDGNRNGSASLGATYRSEGGTVATLNGWINRNKTDFDSTGEDPGVTHTEQSQLGAVSGSVRSALTDRWDSEVKLGYSRDSSENRASDLASFNIGDFSANNLQFDWVNEVALDAHFKAVLGAGYLHQEGSSTSYDPDFSGRSVGFKRSVGSAWAGLVGSVDANQWQLNVRQDQYSDVGGATTGLLAYGYRITPDWRLTAQISNAFRAPSFNDLYFPFFGNPDLSSERSNSGELGVQYATPAASFRASLYRTDTRDLIVFDPSTSRVENLAKARVSGFELGGTLRSGNWITSANCTVLRATDETTGEELLRRAPWLVNAALSYQVAQWNAGFEISVVGPREDLDIATFERVTLESYVLARLVGSISITPQLRLRLRVENLFDAKVETVSGYNSLPRTAIVGVELKL